MSRALPPEPPTDPDPTPPGHVGTTGPGPLVGFGSVALVLGWAVRPLSIRLGVTEPNVSWVAIAMVFFMAAIVGGAAYLTWTALHRHHQRLQPHQAVNRLVLGKACALVGAVIAGGYFGYAVAHLGVTDSDLATARLWRSVVAGIGGLAVTTAALLLERACRVRRDDD
ncbi:MAG: hypothetical protein JWR35_1518 [Marmoricola sp.]|nr:hypothetical protein [Marmoricola sp.]